MHNEKKIIRLEKNKITRKRLTERGKVVMIDTASEDGFYETDRT